MHCLIDDATARIGVDQALRHAPLGPAHQLGVGRL